MAEQSRDAIARAKRLQDSQLEWRKRLIQARALTLLLRLVDSLFESPVITIPIAKQLLGVTYPSAQRNVEKLIKEKILEPWRKTSYGKMFFAGEILLITGELET